MQCVHAIAQLIVSKRPLAKSYSSYVSIKRPDLNIYRDKCLRLTFFLRLAPQQELFFDHHKSFFFFFFNVGPPLWESSFLAI